MRGRVQRHAHELLRGLWFRPLVVAICIALLAPLLSWIERAAGGELLKIGFANSGDTERTVIALIAGEGVSVVALIFSLTIVAAQLVSQQSSPRASGALLQHPTPQVVAGILFGVDLYCLLVLAEVPSDKGNAPALPVLGAVALGIVAIVAVLVFVHYVSTVIQLENVAASVADETMRSIDQTYRQPYDPGTEAASRARAVGIGVSEGEAVRAPRKGYVQQIRFESLSHRIRRVGCAVEITVRPGDFVTTRSVVARVDPPSASAAFSRRISGWLAIGNQRDLSWDPGFGIEQLRDIASRALSPGINDPTTARSCIHHLCALFERLAVRDDRVDTGLAVASYPTFEELLGINWVEVARYAASNPWVATALLDALQRVARAAASVGATARLAAISAAAREVGELALRSAVTERDKAVVDQAMAWQSRIARGEPQEPTRQSHPDRASPRAVAPVRPSSRAMARDRAPRPTH